MKKELLIIALMVCMHNIILFPGRSRGADVYDASFEFEYDLTVDRSDEGTERDQTFRETFDLDYSQNVLPRLDVDATFKLEVEQQFQSGGEKTTRLLPELEITGSADYWTLDLGAKRTRESTDQPFEPASISDSYFVEYLLEPKARVPDLKLKYTIDTDEQGSDTDTEDRGLELSSVYELGEIVKLKVDYTRDESLDKINPDSDTVDESFKTEETIQYIFSSKIKFDFKHSYDTDKGATLLDGGGRTNESNSNSNTIDAKLSYPIFPKTEVNADYKFTRDQDKIGNAVNRSQDFGLDFNQGIGQFITFDFSYTRSISEQSGPDQGSQDTNENFQYDLTLPLTDLFDFSLSYSEDSTETEDRIDIQNSKKTSSDSFDFTWSASPESFWDFQASYTWSIDRENGIATGKNRDMSFTLDLLFDYLGLDLSADYSQTITEDFTTFTDQKSRTIDFNFSMDYSTDITNKLGFSFSHQFGRSVEQPGKIISRDDDTTVDFTLSEPWRGSSFNLSLSRNATDTSGDDSEADITSNISFSWDHSFKFIDFSAQYTFDKKRLSDDSENIDFQVGWTGLNFSTELTYSYDKTFSSELDESHSLTFNFTMDI